MTVRDRSQLLRRLVRAIVALGAGAVLGSLILLNGKLDGDQTWVLPAMAGLTAVASAAVVRVRLRATSVGTAWTDAAILVCIVTGPPAWAPVCVFIGVFVAKLLGRLPPLRAAYNAAKDALSATVGVAVALALGVAAAGEHISTQPVALVAVALTVALTENAIGVPVLALASGASWHRVLRENGELKIAAFLGKFLVAWLTLQLVSINSRLLAVIPPVALCLHLLYSSRVRARAERSAWQRLAATTEELNSTDLEAVLTAAVVNGARLFSAAEAEVFLRDGPDGPLLVRGDADGVLWSGEPGLAPPRRSDGESVTARLAGHDLKEDLGEVRLHYAGRVRLTDRERLTLRTFVSALRTAVRNASAFAEARRLALRNAHAALHDPLTGLANRRRLHDYGASVLVYSGTDTPDVALVVLDLDMFREVNETLGHTAGDRLLTEVARRLREAAGPEDLVARLGGDEFAVLLVGRSYPRQAEQRARELLATLDAPVDLGEMRVRVEASAGLAAVAPTAADDPDLLIVELLRRADVAMYQAKRGGPRIVRFDAGLDTADLVQLMLGGDLPRAVAEREFTVLFQPIVDLASGRMVAAEALARWHHPDRGYLDPRRFLAAVERSGLLPAFAEAVLDQALDAMKQWRAVGIDAPVAVNASPRSLLDPTFPRMVTDRLAAHGLSGDALVIELTESLTLGQVDMVGGVLRQLRAAGIRLALDDFGTGYSSLAMLAKVPVYELKIDRGFVAAMRATPEAAAVVRSTIELGRSLDLVVVAEGVEDVEQRALLYALGCPAGQGHLFAKPLPIGELLELLGGDSVGRLSPPLHPNAGNVIGLPRVRRAEPDPRTEQA